MKIKKGDEVVIIAGKDRGERGKVLAVFPDENKVIVEGRQVVTKHTRVTAGARGAKQGGIEHVEAKIDASNVMLVEDGKATRVGYRKDENGKNVRISKRTGKDL
jgi:large subunit ribosomal protein L24